MSKPIKLPQWATNLTNNTEPSSGQKATGWTTGQAPPSAYMNWWMFVVYQWCAYLDAGNLDGDHLIDGDLEVTGDLLVGQDVSIAGDVTIASGVTVANDAAIVGKATVGGLAHTDDWEVPCGLRFADAPAGTTLAGPGVAVTTAGNLTLNFDSGMRKGDRIKSAKITIFKTTTGATTFQLFRHNAGTATAIGPVVSTNLTGNQEVLISVTGAGYVLFNEDVIFVAVTNVSVSGADYYRSITPLFDRPV